MRSFNRIFVRLYITYFFNNLIVFSLILILFSINFLHRSLKTICLKTNILIFLMSLQVTIYLHTYICAYPKIFFAKITVNCNNLTQFIFLYILYIHLNLITYLNTLHTHMYVCTCIHFIVASHKKNFSYLFLNIVAKNHWIRFFAEIYSFEYSFII